MSETILLVVKRWLSALREVGFSFVPEIPDCISNFPIHLESNDLSFASKSVGGL